MLLSIKTFFKNILDHPEIIFVIIALFFGSIMIRMVPPGEVPDGHDHIRKAAEIADGKFYSKEPIKTVSLDKYLKQLFVPEDKTGIHYTNTEKFHMATRNCPIMYLTSALGLKTASLFSQNPKTMFYFGRFFNLIAYILLCFFAIRLTPVFKYPFMFTALFPMSIFEGMSFSADSFNNGFSFLFFAFVFKLIFDKQEMTKKDLTILSIFSVIGPLCKSLIYPVFLYIFLPPPVKDLRFKNKFVYIIPLMLLTVAVCYMWIKISPVNIHPDYPVINDVTYIFKEPSEVIYRIYNTTSITFINMLFFSVCLLGWEAIKLPVFCYYLTFGAFIIMFFGLNEKVKLNIRIIALFSFILMYFIIQYTHLIFWSPVNHPYVIGFQGRYLIPLYPLFFVIFGNSVFKFNEKFKYFIKSMLVLFNIFLLLMSIFSINWFYNYMNLNSFSEIQINLIQLNSSGEIQINVKQ